LGRTEFRPKDYMRTFVGDDEFVQPKRNETAPRSKCRFTFKNALTQPRLLDVKPASRKLTPNIHSSHDLNRPEAKRFCVKLTNLNIPKIDLVEVFIDLLEAENLKAKNLADE
jgi:hypothetical protein